jgi:hypothetical protein
MLLGRSIGVRFPNRSRHAARFARKMSRSSSCVWCVSWSIRSSRIPCLPRVPWAQGLAVRTDLLAQGFPGEGPEFDVLGRSVGSVLPCVNHQIETAWDRRKWRAIRTSLFANRGHPSRRHGTSPAVSRTLHSKCRYLGLSDRRCRKPLCQGCRKFGDVTSA